MRNLIRSGLALFALALTCFGQPVVRNPSGGGTNIVTSTNAITGIDTTQLRTNASGTLGIANAPAITNANLRGATAITGATVTQGLTNLSLTVGRVMIVGADQQESSSSVTDDQLVALLSAASGMPTLNGSMTNASSWGTFTNRVIIIIHFDPTNTTDKDFQSRYSDYYSDTNMFGGVRGKSTSSNSDLYIGPNDAASPENIYVGTGPRGHPGQSPQFKFSGTGAPRVRGDFLPITHNTNDIGSASLMYRAVYGFSFVVESGGFGVFYGGGTATPELVKTGAKGASFLRPQFGEYKKLRDSVSSDNSRGWALQPNILTFGTTNLTAGTVTINNSLILSTAKIQSTHAIIAGTPGFLSSSIIPGTSFTITSSDSGDTSTIHYTVAD